LSSREIGGIAGGVGGGILLLALLALVLYKKKKLCFRRGAKSKSLASSPAGEGESVVLEPLGYHRGPNVQSNFRVVDT
jgi:hypothetical protein